MSRSVLSWHTASLAVLVLVLAVLSLAVPHLEAPFGLDLIAVCTADRAELGPDGILSLRNPQSIRRPQDAVAALARGEIVIVADPLAAALLRTPLDMKEATPFLPGLKHLGIGSVGSVTIPLLRPNTVAIMQRGTSARIAEAQGVRLTFRR